MKEDLIIKHTSCSHCGEPVESSSHSESFPIFCCQGCKTVYHLLKENNLCTYYDLDDSPGITIKNGLERKRFDYLIDKDVQNKLIDFKDSEIASSTFYIPNIHCTSCVWLLENLQKLDEGIVQGTVNFLKKRLSIIFDTSKTDLRNIVELLTTIGYEPNLKLVQLEEKEHQPIPRGLWLKLGVAGFCFGNIMLFSFPEYLNMSVSDSLDSFKIFFGALNIILATPVLIYSSSDYIKSAWAAISQKGINLDVPITIGIFALFGRSLYEILSGTGIGYFDSFAGFIFFLLIGKIVQKKTFDGLSFDRDYKSYLPISVLKLIDGKEQSVSVKTLEIGDEIVLRNNELVPCDSILQSDGALVDYSFITGESDPVTKLENDLIYAGGRIIGSQCRLLVTKKVAHSYLTQLWENDVLKSDESKDNRSLADRISPFFTSIVIGIAILSCLFWLYIDPSKAFTIFTAVLIVACPCALALSAPFTFGSATNILSLNGLFLKTVDGIQKLGSIDTIVFDKTGTITDSRKANITFHGYSLSKFEKELIIASTKSSTHPYSQKIYSYLNHTDVDLQELDFIEEINGKGIHAISGDSTIYVGSKNFIEESTGLDLGNNRSYQTSVHIAIDENYKGFFEFKNQLRNGLKELLNKLQSNYETHLLSGDNEKDAVQLSASFKGDENMHFNHSPQQKLTFIHDLSATNKILMIGDGLNDAGALKKSHFGISISDRTSSFSPACDAILDGDELKNLDNLIGFAKASNNIVNVSFGISLLYNITGLAFAVTGHLSPLVAAILMPLSSISIMFFTTVATRIKAKNKRLKIWV
ncbi:MAG: heavy metal translocating P-type ATPase metal-binding domain-containing protein [Balneola sp.]